MLIIKRVTDIKEQEEIFRQRYRIFVERDKDAPAELYANGLLKDKCDDSAIHIGCYNSLDGSLLGFLSIVLKIDINTKLPIEEQHNIVAELESAEIMRLIILEDSNIKLKGHILSNLLREVGKIVQEFSLNMLYLVTTKDAEKIYKKIGFSQMGPYKMYKNISNECPMFLKPSEVNNKIIC